MCSFNCFPFLADCPCFCYLALSHSEVPDFINTTLSPGCSKDTAGIIAGTCGKAGRAGAGADGLDSTRCIISSRFLSLC